MKKKVVLVLIILVVIFGLSSDKYSNKKTIKITNIIINTFNINNSKENKIKINYYLRKSCHITEYFILSIVICSLLDYKGYVLVIITSILDERFQLYIGRTGCFKDIVIDCTGGLVGMFFIMIIKIFDKK